MNSSALIGNLTRDPELRTTASGTSVCNFTIAVQRRFKNQDGEYEADFIPIVVWRELANICAKYLAKGRKVGVRGSIQTRRYEDKDGNKRTQTEIIADEVEFLTKPDAGTEQPNPFGPENNSLGEPVSDESLPF